MIDRYALELERAIFNYRLGGNNASYVPVANALMNGMANGMEVLVPVRQKDSGLRLFDPNDDHPIRQTDEDESPIYVQSIGVDGIRHIVPAFTSEEELSLGEHTDVMRCRMSDLIQNMKGWTGCTGIAVNPYNLTFNIQRTAGPDDGEAREVCLRDCKRQCPEHACRGNRQCRKQLPPGRRRCGRSNP